MRLIDADALIERLKPYIDKYGAKKFSYNMVHEAFIYEVEQEPTVDAVPVVRCEQCTWRNMGECMFWSGEGMYTEDNDYCSRGKRKEE